MGRPRTFDTDAVVAAAAAAFRRFGYEGTSVDDLVAATGLHRGSLYGAFGSKRGLFVTALRTDVTERLPAALAVTAAGGADASAAPGAPVEGADLLAEEVLDLVLVAALELAPRDEEARDLVGRARELLDGVRSPTAVHPPGGGPPAGAAALLGARLLHRAGAASRGGTAGAAPPAAPHPAPPPTTAHPRPTPREAAP